MPFFHYVARDRKGAQVEGTVQASTTEEASRVLAERGFNVLNILDPNRSAMPAVFRTKRGTDKQRFFLFAQIANLLKAGVNPADGFNTLAAQTPHTGYKESLKRIGTATSEGASMSQVMSLYPDLYPEHVVGLVQAGEVGGFLPDACAAVSEQAGSAHKFRLWHWILWATLIIFAIAMALAAVMGSAVVGAFHKNWSGQADPSKGGATVWLSIKEAFVGPVGVGVMIALAAIAIGIWWLTRPRSEKVRHWFGSKGMVYGRRATHEGVTIFSWALSRLSRSGVSPNSAWTLAARCVPNMTVRDRLVDAGHRMTSTSRVSEAVFGAKLFPQEFAPVISTGEMTGDLPGSLDRLAQASRSSYDTVTNLAKVRLGCWGCLLFVAGGFGGMTVVYYFYTRICWYLIEHGAD